MNLKERILNWLFERLFGHLDIRAEINVTSTHIMVVDIVTHTRFGEFTFPLLHKELPRPGETVSVKAIRVTDDEHPDTRPA